MIMSIWLNEGTAQEISPSSTILDGYIQAGLSNNMALQQKQFSLQKSLLALKEAKGYYLPTITFQSDYSLASGGRKINLPLGDLMNNAYSSLNRLTASSDFKMLENQDIALLQPKLQDTRIQTYVPLINTEIRYFNEIQKEAIIGKQAEVNLYKRELIRDIRIAYYNYQQAGKIAQIYKNADHLLQENLRYTAILLKNSKGLKSNLLKVQVQLSQNTSHLIEAENKSEAAVAYFNFLINRPLTSAIASDSTLYELSKFQKISYPSQITSGREEIRELNSMIKQSVLLVKKNRSSAIPQLAAFMNAGNQGSNFNLNAKNSYLVGGVQLKWLIFNGFKTSNKVKQASNELQELELKLKETKLWFELENRNKNLELNSAYAKLAGSKASQLLSAEFYRETQLRYRHGEALAIELLDAFTQLINSQLDVQLDQTSILIKQAEVERVTAAYSL